VQCALQSGVFSGQVAHGTTGPAIDVYVGGPTGKKFNCNMAMAQQANEFQKIYEVMGDVHIEAHGPGLIAEILRVRREQAMAA
jgi:hypothetical protein